MSCYFKSDIEAMSAQEIVDWLNFAESVIKVCDRVMLDKDSLEVHVGKGLVRIPKNCSTYKRIKSWGSENKKNKRKKAE